MTNPWLDLSFKAFQLGLEAQSAIALRMMRLPPLLLSPPEAICGPSDEGSIFWRNIGLLEIIRGNGRRSAPVWSWYLRGFESVP